MAAPLRDCAQLPIVGPKFREALFALEIPIPAPEFCGPGTSGNVEKLLASRALGMRKRKVRVPLPGAGKNNSKILSALWQPGLNGAEQVETGPRSSGQRQVFALDLAQRAVRDTQDCGCSPEREPQPASNGFELFSLGVSPIRDGCRQSGIRRNLRLF